MAGAGLVIHDAQYTPEEYLDAFVEAIDAGRQCEWPRGEGDSG
jgi:hypothetical protein